jgi:hypothetical protein
VIFKTIDCSLCHQEEKTASFNVSMPVAEFFMGIHFSTMGKSKMMVLNTLVTVLSFCVM